jgi:hypothetical protein
MFKLVTIGVLAGSSQQRRLGISQFVCKTCVSEGYQWCEDYASPFADTFCDRSIPSTTCKMLIATTTENCDDKRYNS